MPCLWPSSSATATFSSDKRKVSLHVEIMAHAGELLIALPGGCVATLAEIPLRQIPQLSLGMHFAHEIGAGEPPCEPVQITLQAAKLCEIKVLWRLPLPSDRARCIAGGRARPGSFSASREELYEIA